MRVYVLSLSAACGGGAEQPRAGAPDAALGDADAASPSQDDGGAPPPDAAAADSDANGDAATPDASPASCAFSYHQHPVPASSDDFLTTANAEGANGYRYFGTASVHGTTIDLYVRDGASGATFSYELLDNHVTAAGFVAQATSEGAKGFRYEGLGEYGSSFSNVYVKDSTMPGPLLYERATPTTTQADFLAQTNEEGQRGYALDKSFVASDDSGQLYVNASDGAKFRYELVPASATMAESLATLNAEGARGFRRLQGARLGGVSLSVFVSDTRHTGAFTVSSAIEPDAVDDFMTLLDAQGSNGLRYDGLAGVSGTQGYGAFVDLGANACGQGLLYGTLHD